jgi:diadenosine tetraphosphatase ApaH/serine/threonine PP2A family protein phosphatase
MKLALFTDLHANREAFEACFDAAQRAGAQRFALLGDLVGYGADPGWVVDRVIELAKDGAVVVRGNHDDGVVFGPRSTMTEDASRAVLWTREQLSDAQIAFLDSLPYTVEHDELLFTHANAFAPQEWEYVVGGAEAARSLNATRARITFCGHMHDPMLYGLSATGKITTFTPVPDIAIPVSPLRQWLAIPGSVGQPRDRNPAACWALFDAQAGELVFHRVPYDHDMAATKVLAAGLPAFLAERLRDGR